MLEALGKTAYSDWVRESWGWAFALTIHAFGNAIVVGLVLIMALRLFGLFRTIPYTALPKLFPFIWVAIVFQAAVGDEGRVEGDAAEGFYGIDEELTNLKHSVCLNPNLRNLKMSRIIHRDSFN